MSDHMFRNKMGAVRICIVRSQFSVNHWGAQACDNLVALIDARKFCFLIRRLLNVCVHFVEIY